MPLGYFHPLIRDWFQDRFGEPTEPQKQGWPQIASGRNTLIAAPTGSGKTLAAFLVCIDQLWRDASAGQLDDTIHVVYVSPLKALSNDIDRNLQTPLAELSDRAKSLGIEPPEIRTALRTGDTPAAQRQSMLRRPPHILVTTPESLFILLTSQKSRELLRSVRTVIVDEIHALARDKRGSHLALSLERLTALCDRPPVRIGLSATQRPIEDIARFLAGPTTEPVEVIDVGHVRQLDLAIETPPSELSAVCSHEQWGEVYQRLCELITSHRSTLVFVNTRRLAERVGHQLREILGDEAVASHHGSLAREIRLSAEQRLKNGQLKAIVATASLEMGIDIGYIDLVCQIGSPRSIATFLQRIGRSGHSLGRIPKGRLFPLTRDELLECLAMVRAVGRRELDRIEIPVAPLDILAQQVVAAVACEDWNESQLYELVRKAWPYRELPREEFDRIIHLLSEGVTPNNRRGAYLHRDRIHQMLRPRRGARLAAITSGGAIPDTAEYRVVIDPDGTFVGKLDEDFAIESLAGDVFLLGNNSWRIKHVRAGEVVVTDAEGAAPSIPFWLGEGPGRTIELSEQVSQLRTDVAHWQARGDSANDIQLQLQNECGATPHSAQQANEYIQAQVAALGVMPSRKQIVFERFFDESGGMQLVIHAPLGQRINRAWGLALRKRFCRSFDFELQAAATDNGLLLSLSPQHSFPIDSLFKMLGPHNGEQLLQQAVLVQPMFQVRWRWNVTRALMVLRQQNGKRVPPHMIRFRTDDLLAAAFPETVGCLENHHGDVEIPDHPLVKQTMYDCLHEAMDVNRWIGLLGDIRSGGVELLARDTREPSPFCHEILNAYPYAFLDGAPLEERRTRAVSSRRTFTAEEVRDLAKLDPAAVAQVREEAWPLVRNSEELHDVLHNMVVLLDREIEPWSEFRNALVAEGRATAARLENGQLFWVAAERLPIARALYPNVDLEPALQLPDELDVPVEQTAALVELIRGRVAVRGPVLAAELAAELALEEGHVTSALEVIESSGNVLRGYFSSPNNSANQGVVENSPPNSDKSTPEWCDRRLLSRIHRLTLDGLRQKIKPVAPEDFLRFLVRRHRIHTASQWSGPLGLREAIGMLQGFEAAAGAWEKQILSARVAEYDPQWLDHLFLSGEVLWGRLRQPKRDEQRSTVAALTRVVPISLMLREDLPWLVAPADPAMSDAVDGRLRGHSQRVLELLSSRGALFFQELKSQAQLLPAHLDEALRELAARGLVTCDGFAAVRSFVRESKSSRRHSDRSRLGSSMNAPAGRWSRFPGELGELLGEERLTRWCRLLLNRYGVIFRDLLTREACAPGWHELVPILRRMELRGDIRGGRFVLGVAGEQFAAESAVEQLRATRDEADDDFWVLLSAADPLNLCGIVGSGPRVTATPKNSVILRGGRFVAAKQAGQVEFFVDFPPEQQAEMRRALQTGRRQPESHVPAAWSELKSIPLRPRSLSDAPSRTIRRP